MSVFDSLAVGYDLGLLPLEWAVLRRLRRRAFPPVQGRVLEVGVGTGANLPLYQPAVRVVALDMSSDMLRRAVLRPGRAAVLPVQANVHSLPFADGSFDTVTGSLVFCSVANPRQALAQAWRVLRPDGRLVLVEHTRGKGLGAWLTDTLHPAWLAWNRVCHLNRETAQTVTEAGFRLTRVEAHWLGIFRIIEGAKE